RRHLDGVVGSGAPSTGLPSTFITCSPPPCCATKQPSSIRNLRPANHPSIQQALRRLISRKTPSRCIFFFRTPSLSRTNTRKCRAAAALMGGRDVASDQSRSTDLKVVRRLLAAITDNLIFDRLTLVERTKAGTLDSGDMDEHVSAAILGLNESIALGRVEPFDSASSHHRLLECTNVIGAARPSRDRSSEISVVLGKHPGMRNKQCQVRTLRF